jgi:hypothetical protein
MDIFGFGFPGLIGDPRTLTDAQINELCNCSDLRQIRSMANYNPYPAIERDERFGYCYEIKE